MKKFFFACLFVFSVVVIHAQYTVRLLVTNVGSASKNYDNLFVAGSFNNWNPSDNTKKLKPFAGGRFLLVLNDVKPGSIEFKFTRGDWNKVETTASGDDIDNRTATINGDTTIEVAVAGWKDNFPVRKIPNTASANVHLLDSSFFIPQLNRHRRIWIYLPASYQQQKNKSYPVLYMQDGQNLFNEKTSAFGMEWGVDECLDTLESRINRDCIVIGIDNDSAKRMTEYNPYDDTKYGKGEGKQYLDFIANTLKPYVDKNYRTLKDAKNTFITGSSMGGLISMYALIAYPDVFGGAGIFSPAFWIAPQIYTDVTKAKLTNQPKIYFYAGEKESNSMMNDMQRMYNIIKPTNCCDVRKLTFPLGEHNEKYWRQDFDDFYRWLMQ